MSAKAEFEQMMERSDRFLKTAESTLEKGFLDISSFNANQALELFLKARVLRLAGDYPHTHDIKELLITLGKVCEPKYAGTVENILREKSLELKAVQDTYITSRYFFTSSSENEVNRMIGFIKELERSLEDVR